MDSDLCRRARNTTLYSGADVAERTRHTKAIREEVLHYTPPLTSLSCRYSMSGAVNPLLLLGSKFTS